MIKAHEYQLQVVKQAYNRRGWIYSDNGCPNGMGIPPGGIESGKYSTR